MAHIEIGDGNDPGDEPARHDPADTSMIGADDDETHEAADADVTSSAPAERQQINTVELPDDIDDILTNRLYQDPVNPRNAQYRVEGRPDLYVREDREGNSFDRQEEVKAHTDRLLEHGVNVLPSSTVEHGEKVYTVTNYVSGLNLDRALMDEPTEELVREVDTTLKGVTDNLAACRQEGRPVTPEVVDVAQYMYGTTADDPVRHVRLVDLPEYTVQPEVRDHFEELALALANEVAYVEDLSGQPLPDARAAIEAALPLSQYSPVYGDGLPNAARYVLEHGEEIELDFGTIQGLRTNGIRLPDDIEHLVETDRLIPTDMPGADTAKMRVEGHPDLLVRITEGVTLEQAAVAKQATDALRDYGVEVLPSVPMEHDGQLKIVTHVVDGVDLDTEFHEYPYPSEGVVEQTDHTLAGLTNRLMDCLNGNEPYPASATSTEHFMFGHTAADPTDKVRLVDLPTDTIRPAQPDVFELELLELANAVARTEGPIGTSATEALTTRQHVEAAGLSIGLWGARTAIENALSYCRDSRIYGDGLKNAIRRVLQTNQPIHLADDDELIHSLRNY